MVDNVINNGLSTNGVNLNKEITHSCSNSETGIFAYEKDLLWLCLCNTCIVEMNNTKQIQDVISGAHLLNSK